MKPAAIALVALLPAAASAGGSCWVHNGSLMRLSDTGSARAFTYEVPRPGLRAAGVGPGTLLFEGENLGNWYQGTAYVFSEACPGSPLGYWVEGPVGDASATVTLRGQREVHQACAPTGRWTDDTLVFTYSHAC